MSKEYFGARLLTAFASLSALAAPPVVAQEVSGQTASELGEIVVTAERRTERETDVPASITTITPATLATDAVTDIRDLTMEVPGLHYSSTGPWVGPVIRGVFPQATGPGQSSATGIYVDGVYQGSLQGGALQFPDIQSIQVLEGPQGTLFGRNSTGGAILIATQDPQLGKLTGNASIGFGNYDAYSAKGFLSVPMGETLAASLAVYREKADGMYQDVLRGGYNGANDVTQIRAKIMFQPSDAVKFILGGSYRDWEDDRSQVMSPIDGATLAAITYPGTRTNFGPWQDALNDGPLNLSRTHDVNLRGLFDFDAVSLTSTTSYSVYDNQVVLDADGTAAPVQAYLAWTTERYFEQEFLLSHSTGRLKWLAGVNYFGNEAYYDPLHVTYDGPSVYSIYSLDKGSAKSAFADGTLQLMDELTLTAGVRYTDEGKRFSAAVNENPSTAQGSIPYLPLLSEKNWVNFSPRVALTRALSATSNVYVSYSEGFRSGTYSSSTPGPPVAPEKVDAYELGFKGLWPGRFQLDTALYLDNYTNIQVAAQSPLTHTTFYQNAAAGRIYGFEIAPTLEITSSLRARGSLNLLHATYTDFPNASIVVPTNTVGLLDTVVRNISGNDLVGAPHITAMLALDYSYPLPRGVLVTNVAAHYESTWFAEQGNTWQAPASTIINGTLTWKPAGANWSVGLWGKNLTNSTYWTSTSFSSVAALAAYGPPRTYGVTASAEF